jgi:hypothetical protein
VVRRLEPAPRLIARLVRYGSGFNPLGPADDDGLARLARCFTTICVKPSQFIDETAAIGVFCRSLAAKTTALGEQP